MQSSLLPLLAPRAGNSLRRQRQLQWSEITRLAFRRRTKFYLILLALTTIFAVSIIHRLISSETLSQYGNHDSDSKKEQLEARTMKTIIGKYVGPKPSWSDDSFNISPDELNANNYDPDPEIGRDGRPAYLPGYPQERMKKLYSINRFNLVVSDKISVDRKLPDTRKLACRKMQHDSKSLYNTSVIIVFHNEAWSTLVRTVHSIINTSPQHLLAEILLVDDASNRTFLGRSLDYYMNNLGSIHGVNIRVLRSSDRIGLIRSRLLGVKVATGKVLTFIDAHCEATTGWLEPLLEQIKLNRKSVACPIIDIINEDTFAFTRSFELHVGAINWGLNFRWYPISRRELVASNGYYGLKEGGKKRLTELVKPFRTPVMAGGLFSVERDYFNEMGAYDSHMDIWGGENIELSLRLWQCGGEVRIVPCSHVAHVFRKSSPYTFRPGKEVSDILYSNLARVAEVWMDEWREFFYLLNPIVNKTLIKVGREVALREIEGRKNLRRRLECKNFKWFLEHVWPAHFFPTKDRFFGSVRQEASGKCLQRPQYRVGRAIIGAIETSKCAKNIKTHQMFVFDRKRGFLMTDENVCLDSGSDPMPSRQVMLVPCSESQRQKWNYTTEMQFVHLSSGLCLDSPIDGKKVQFEKCNLNQSSSTKWSMNEVSWDQARQNSN